MHSSAALDARQHRRMGRKSRSPSATRSSKTGSCPQGAASCLEMPREITHHLAVFFTARAPARPPLELDGEDWHLHMQETLGDPNTRRSHWRCCSEFICKFQCEFQNEFRKMSFSLCFLGFALINPDRPTSVSGSN